MSLGEMEIQQLSASGLVRCLEELQSRGNAVGAHWCTTCRLLSIGCTCEPGTRRISTIRTTDAMVRLVTAARCSSHINVEFFT